MSIYLRDQTILNGAELRADYANETQISKDLASLPVESKQSKAEQSKECDTMKIEQNR